ncbi:cytochrome oxidase chain II [Chlamydia pneumoniae TW-183]|uniref:Cytochrome D ubiquinol oxidase, subunit II n=2 Tax=Chlamydia pneumoniae TaxID=83558 RepID=Q9Z978_CHLPN|nr:cytochrome d ubiquinol oxidase subunit II [Chlamydia pneumoniae]AAD18256.1 Cytochrome Oxidase Subunit II [Chlamydia pneumoniae CWL029]AAF38483.1 cytochrome D ubiquinol oxidase, subunit II [Chlamydia pneumoniae AR39]AAP98036.1 cytochrome oxidase chain II [Chlamydia pneumoniae TW-183]CRI32600.1 Cytochrome D ubiquinol oxidase, subunit II [Chlamydia pneumoniae]CRI36587.1 Cytochrome D ubiquinol oxidase, subunit II [Chlamydia pneumoniae]
MELSLTSLLPLAWYVILGVAVFAYSFGDGFDLGLGAVYLKAKEDKERRILLNSIGPVWDGNEVWLVIIVGGLFAGFPACYATLLSIFYMPIWTLVLLYIFRGCSLEFRSKSESVSWKIFWDIIFICSGTAISFFLGTIVGNLILGLPLSPDTSYASLSWILFFRPYAALCGAVVASAFAIHGSCFALMKTSDSLNARIAQQFPYILSSFLVFYVLFLGASLISIPKRFDAFPTYPLLILLIALTSCCCVAAKTSVSKKRYGYAFIYSTLNLLSLILSAATLTFPNILLSTVDPQYSYTIYNSAVETKTLKSLLIIVLIGLPFIITYTCYIYRVFRGKTNFPSIY